jgi:hypothetical protein
MTVDRDQGAMAVTGLGWIDVKTAERLAILQ